jgi:DNA-binding Xre family transcriptional regulator
MTTRSRQGTFPELDATDDHHYSPSGALTSDDAATGRVDGDTVAFMRAVGQAMRAARQSMGWRLADLAQRVGLSPSQLCRLETGARPIHMGRLFLLCRALGIQPQQVIAWAQREAFPVGHDAWADTVEPCCTAAEVTTTPAWSRPGSRKSRPTT